MARPGLLLLPLDSGDRGSQRCRAGPRALAALGLGLGAPVRVWVPGGAALCWAWPRRDRADGFLQLDSKCASPGLRGLSPGRGLGRLEPVSCTRLRRVCVRAVLGAPGAGGGAALQRLAAEALRGVLLSPGFVVRVSGPAAAGCPGPEASPGLVLLEVGSVEPPTAGAGLLSARAAVRVTEVLSLERYRGSGRAWGPAAGPEPPPPLSPLGEALGLPLRYPRAAARLGLACPRVLLLGPPGVGKSRLARRLARELGAEVLEAGPAEIHGPRPGQSEERLRAVWARARERTGLLLIDDIDSLCPARADSGPGARLLAQLLTLLDRPGPGPLAVIAASSRPEAVDPALRRPGRFDREVTVGVPTTSQRRSILEGVTAPMPLSADVNVSWLAEATSGYVAADLTALCREAALQVVRHSSQESVEKEITFADFREALKIVHPSSLRSSIGLTDFRPVQWDQIGGLDQVKLKLRQSIEWPMMFPEAFVRMGVTPTRGILLYGPPGCAKTTLVKAAASSCRCSFLSVSGADLFSPFVGDSEKALAQVFRQARAAAPSVLFLDEIDSMLGSRSLDATNGRSVHERVLSVLLSEMDGIGQPVTVRRGSGMKILECEGEQSEEQTKKLEFQEVCNKDVIVVAATNRPDLLDDALLRPGRFDQIIFVPSPDKEARLSILRICTSKTPLDDVSLEELADETAGFTGADLQNLCKEAALLALQENGLDAAAVNHCHFLRSLQSLKPSLTQQQLEFYQNLFSPSDLC